MKNGTKEEYLMLDKHEQDYINGTADGILSFMSGLNSTLEGLHWSIHFKQLLELLMIKQMKK